MEEKLKAGTKRLTGLFVQKDAGSVYGTQHNFPPSIYLHKLITLGLLLLRKEQVTDKAHLPGAFPPHDETV